MGDDVLIGDEGDDVIFGGDETDPLLDDGDDLLDGGPGADFAECAEVQVECYVCRTLNASDSMNRDCDDFDDGEDNGSCPAD